MGDHLISTKGHRSTSVGDELKSESESERGRARARERGREQHTHTQCVCNYSMVLVSFFVVLVHMGRVHMGGL
jgi:hypothetical protein